MKKETLKLMVEGGKASPGPTTAPRLGALGLNVGQVFEAINKATAKYEGLQVPVTLEVDIESKSFKVKVGTPPVASLIKKELGVEKVKIGEEEKAKGVESVGDLKMEQVVKIAKLKRKGMLVGNLKAAVKSVLGTAVSMPITVEGKPPKEVLKEVEEGKWDQAMKD